MMVTAVLMLTLAAAGVPAVQVEGQSRCPTASEVAAILPEMLPATEAPYPGIAWIQGDGLNLQIELRALDGEVLFSRQIMSSGTCADLATIAAVVIASWTTERNAGISLLQPGVLPPARPATAPPPSVPVTGATSAAVVTPRPGGSREFDLSVGLGGSANGDGLVGAGRVDAGMRGRRLGLRAGFAAETQRRTELEPGSVSWRRFGVSLGPTLALVQRPVRLDARAEIFAGYTAVAGHGFDVNGNASAVAPGLALALRLGTSTGWIRPWIEVGGQYWLASQQIVITRKQPPNPRVSLASSEGRVFAGISVVLSRER
jgi:hypothetical protein